MSRTASADTAARRTPWAIAIALGAAASLIVAVIVLAFLWPTKAMHSENLPVAITGPDAQVTALETALDKAQPGLIDWVHVDDRDAAVDQVETRETYGAIVLDADATTMPEVIKATAGSPAAANILTALASTLTTQLQAQATAAGADASGISVTVTDLAALNANDPTGAGLVAAALPLVMGGMMGGALIAFRVRGTGRKAVALVGYMAASGIVLSAVLGSWFGFLQGILGRCARACPRDRSDLGAPGGSSLVARTCRLRSWRHHHVLHRQSPLGCLGALAVHARTVGLDRPAHGAGRLELAHQVAQLFPRDRYRMGVAHARRVGGCRCVVPAARTLRGTRKARAHASACCRQCG